MVEKTGRIVAGAGTRPIRLPLPAETVEVKTKDQSKILSGEPI
jgi:hypothetical protein